jgi:hypothetical protein
MTLPARPLPFCLLAVLGFLCLGSLAASGQETASRTPAHLHRAGASRPSAVPASYVITPFGYFHPSCVLRIDAGETLLEDGHIQHADGFVEQEAHLCQYPHFRHDGARVEAGETAQAEEAASSGAAKTPPDVNGWLEAGDAFASSGNSYGKVVATWKVPPNPTSHDGQDVYYFPGLEDDNNVISILQPVLQWWDPGPDTGPKWAMSNWNCCVGGNAQESKVVWVNAGDTLVGTIANKCAKGTTVCKTWNITETDKTLGTSTTLTGTPSEGQSFNWAFSGVVEAYNIVQCGDYPPGGGVVFNATLYDQNLKQVSNPWTGWEINGSPFCGYAVTVKGNNTTLSYNSKYVNHVTESLLPSSLTFSTTAVGKTSAAKDVTLTNTGKGTLNVFGITAPAGFAESDNCNVPLTHGESCVIAVSFKPIVGGVQPGTLTLSDSAANYTELVSLSGTGSGGTGLANGLHTVENSASGLYWTDPGSKATTVCAKATPDASDPCIELAKSASSKNQKWSFTALGGGYYEIVSDSSGLSVADPGYNATAGTDLVQYPYWDIDIEQWLLTPSGKGYILTEMDNGLAIDPNANTAGSLLRLEPKSSAVSSQVWIIK